mmetsp:Transcript_4703/g.7075  ORF Transcript_4703/g.7075 Transcript_4703/m.7075 type:complete len:201 (-) Transcript_4703:375-977(-)
MHRINMRLSFVKVLLGPVKRTRLGRRPIQLSATTVPYRCRSSMFNTFSSLCSCFTVTANMCAISNMLATISRSRLSNPRTISFCTPFTTTMSHTLATLSNGRFVTTGLATTNTTTMSNTKGSSPPGSLVTPFVLTALSASMCPAKVRPALHRFLTSLRVAKPATAMLGTLAVTTNRLVTSWCQAPFPTAMRITLARAALC